MGRRDGPLVAAPVNLNHPGHYLHWGVIQISVANLVVIVAMVVVFVLALLLPFPNGQAAAMTDRPTRGTAEGAGRARCAGARCAALPPEKLLPDRQPAYVSSWIYVFGVPTIAALVFVLVSGVVLALAGAAWWHSSTVGHFVNCCTCGASSSSSSSWSSTCGGSSSWPPGAAGAR